MFASDAKPFSISAHAAQLTACVLGTALTAIFVLMAIGERVPPQLWVDPQMISLMVMLLGFGVAWWNGLLGGLVSLYGIGLFYALNYSYFNMLPSGWVFPLCFAPGVLLVLAGVLRRRK